MSESPLSLVVDQYIQARYSVIPILPNGTTLPDKAPGVYDLHNERWSLMSGWQKHASNIPSMFAVESWKMWPNANIGILLGGVNKIVALDFDNDRDSLHSIIENIAGISPVKKRGAKGFTAFYRMNDENPETSTRWNKDGEVIVELLSIGKQTVIPPSIHPNGNPYEWIHGNQLFQFQPDDLPRLPDDFVKQVNDIFYGQHAKNKKYYATTSLQRDPTMDEVEDALSHIDPDCTYDDWIKIGFALNKQYGDSGYRLWIDWSSRGTKYKGEKDCEIHWRSFKPDGSVTIRTLFKLARDSGYTSEQANMVSAYKSEESSDDGALVTDFDSFVSNPYFSIVDDKYYDVAINESQVDKDGENNNKDLAGDRLTIYDHQDETSILKPPSEFMLSLIEWLLAISVREQPIYALSSSITAAGILLGQKIRSSTNLRTNMFCITLGASGSGKDSNIKGVQELFRQAMCDDIIGGTPKSGPAIITSMSETNNKKLYQFDEFGLYLSTLTGQSASSYQAEILSNLMKLHSSAGDLFRGDEYRNADGKQSRKDLENPHLCVNGFSTPVRFWEALGSKHAIDGFLSRFLVFESLLASPPKKKVIADKYHAPRRIIEMVKDYNAMPVYVGNNEVERLSGMIRPLKVNFTPEADAHLDAFSDFCDAQKERDYNAGNATDVIWARGHEHAIKLALCCYQFGDIGLDAAQWATSVVRNCINRSIIGVTNNVSDNIYESNSKTILAIIKAAGDSGIITSDLARKTQSMSGMQRNNAINDLLEREQIVKVKKSTSGDRVGRPAVIYRIAQ